VICFVSDYSIIQGLVPSPDEVDRIFTHPLKGCHEGRVWGKDQDELVEIGGEWWPHTEEFYVSYPRPLPSVRDVLTASAQRIVLGWVSYLLSLCVGYTAHK
jgi:hypothetical protein